MSLFNRFLVTTLPLVPKPIVGWVARRYVAGETLEQAVETIRRLNGEGAMATVDLLGEEIEDQAQATAAVEEYQRVLAAIEEHGLDCNISVKPTQLGLDQDESFCRDNIAELVERAAARDGGFVRIDMEDRETTDATLRIYREIHRRQDPGPRGRVGVVFQAYMRRTLQDIAGLPVEGANVRLCKGIYIEPRQAAWKGYETVRLNYLAALEKLLRRGVYVGIATHDEYLVCGAVALIDRLGIPADRYEFQMLLGVEDELRRILLDGGHRLRVYVPYGRDWYLYSIRRLRENPEVAGHVLRAFLSGK
nr:proline dehydrogenase-like [Nerophis lumbriciformis]